jgi:hypothetical protein
MSAAAIEAPTAKRFAVLTRAALRGIGWRHVRAAMLLGLAVEAVHFAVYVQEIRIGLQTMPLLHLLEPLIGSQIRALCLMVAIVIADRAVDEGAPRRRAYVLAAVVGCLAGFVASEPFHWAWRTFVLPDPWPERWWWANGATANIFHPLGNLTAWLPVGCAVVFLYAHRRAARRTIQILHAAELDRIDRSKLAFESRLKAMQARVEPQFLFNTLAQVERLYQIDPALASVMLDDLIAYLRAAMPKMRDTSSTVAQEIELARAYLAIVRIRLGNRLDVSIDVPAHHAAARLPPMMLLPLVDHAVVHGLAPSNAMATISIRTRVSDGRLRLIIVDNGAGFVPEAGGDGLASIRERLDALYGEQASLNLSSTHEFSSQAVLEIPLQVLGTFDESSRSASHP